FEPFRQVKSPRSPEHSGAGLGLHISARLVQAMGGELSVESTAGQGSRFFFELPLRVKNTDGSDPAKFDRRPLVRSQPSQTKAANYALPSAAEIESLLTLSLQGDIVRLRARLGELVRSDAALADFVKEVDELAAGFRMAALSDLLARVRQR
ncbi:MAG: hypothetical protein INR62_08930, partial [Rhodospirillales bacterium]|nr:hypothetical protein [Acetobacter sp.]